MDNAKSGYDIAKELETLTGDKPSSGKLYPFLHELKNNEYIKEKEEGGETDRKKISYLLTESGVLLVQELVERMGKLLDARLEQLLDTCFHCLVKLYDSKVVKIIDGKEMTFCCGHCMGAYSSTN